MQNTDDAPLVVFSFITRLGRPSPPGVYTDVVRIAFRYAELKAMEVIKHPRHPELWAGIEKVRELTFNKQPEESAKLKRVIQRQLLDIFWQDPQSEQILTTAIGAVKSLADKLSPFGKVIGYNLGGINFSPNQEDKYFLENRQYFCTQLDEPFQASIEMRCDKMKVWDTDNFACLRDGKTTRYGKVEIVSQDFYW